MTVHLCLTSPEMFNNEGEIDVGIGSHSQYFNMLEVYTDGHSQQPG